MKKHLMWAAVLVSVGSVGARADNVDFSTFVLGSSINPVESPSQDACCSANSTIAFNYAGNKFVGSVYFNNQLYSTNLSGTGVATFGAPLPESSGSVGEVVVGASLGQAGFASGDIYAGSGADGNIYHYTNSGAGGGLFATVGSGTIRQIFFDPGSSFGGNMLVSTTSGEIYEITSGGVVTPLTNVGEDAEGMDIATSAWGPYVGDLLVSSENSGSVRLINPSGHIDATLTGFTGAETVSFVPLNLNAADPLQGFYVANYPFNVQFAAASNFTSLEGDAIVTSETQGSTMWDVHWNGSSFVPTPFTFTPANTINQFEDGIFVTSQRETGANVPEPSSVILLGSIVLCLGYFLKRKLVS